MFIAVLLAATIAADDTPAASPEEPRVVGPTGCVVTPDMEFPLFFQLKPPYTDSFAALKKHLPKRDWRCFKKGGWAYTSMSRRDAETLLGKHAEFGCVSGAGNSSRANAYSASVKPAKFVPKPLRTFVRRTYFNDDPKFLAIDDPDELDCAKAW